MNHVVMFSGGVGSWAAAKRVAEAHGTDNLLLLFADTKMEDEDLYRFIREAADDVGGEFVTIADGRDPWEVFFDVRFLGNTRVDPCSRVLKRTITHKWVEERYQPDDVKIYLGIDWTEDHRLPKSQEAWLPYELLAPLCNPPYTTKPMLYQQLDRAGIEMPKLYKLGFPHNNCGGFCIKAGQAQFELLLRTMPERYAYHEAKEQEIRELLGDVAILRDRRGGETKPLTMKAFRERIEEDGTEQCDLMEWGGCGCYA